jgi:transposase
MIRVARGHRVWARSQPTDLRKGFAGLAGLVQRELGHDLLAGDLFVFISRSRRLVKILQWDGTGLSLYSKRLGRGQFAEVWRHRHGDQIELTRRTLYQLLEGADVTRAQGWIK